MDSFVTGTGLTKSYGPTVAVQNVSFTLRPGKITALLGGNGAGKSTIMRLISGAARPDCGQLTVGSQDISFNAYTPWEAKKLGVRVVHQELSLCGNLSVTENFFLELGEPFGRFDWRKKTAEAAKRSLELVFPGNRIRPSNPIASLSLAGRQMVEIARAAAAPDLKLLILDEPTSSLDGRRSDELLAYLKKRASEGLAVVFVGHRLDEILDLAEDFLILSDGHLVWSGHRGEIDRDRLISLLSFRRTAGMSSRSSEGTPETPSARTESQVSRSSSLLVQTDERELVPTVTIGPAWHHPSFPGPSNLFPGEIVGLAGLEGSGQQPLLAAIYRGGRNRDLRRDAPVAYVTGDRQKEGVFPLWSTRQNITISRLVRQNALERVSIVAERSWVDQWKKALNLSEPALDKPVLELSGGNQQRALLARALVDTAGVILLNDPTRGVDVGVKQEFYRILRTVAEAGKLIIWYSSEDSEFSECSRVLVFVRGKIAATIPGTEVNREKLVAASFARQADNQDGKRVDRRGASAFSRRHGTTARQAWSLPGWSIPLAALVIVFAAIASFNPRAFSPFGLGLLLGTAVPLVLIALGQMFVVGRSEIDLSIGAFAGLTNVISATLLVDQPLLGVVTLLLSLCGYGILGWIIHVRRIPAIVATLGAAFVWTGIGYIIQPTPGGSAPDWLGRIFNTNIPIVPLPIWLLLVAGGVAFLTNRSRFGVVQRGFGNNERAMKELGWPALRSHVLTYMLNGAFALGAGICLTGINTASDINAAASYTLLSIAAVVMGGCELVGGRIEPLGVVLAAITLSLLGTLLAFLRLSSDNIAAVQGVILLGIVFLRTTWKKKT
ncbi:MAG TPA: ATP-binding cassette domain-containing protein [Chthoniobacterales bacterium]|nr:ATP-binding cassette domain-containing protein [Chthoniobacterales bacterium]